MTNFISFPRAPYMASTLLLSAFIELVFGVTKLAKVADLVKPSVVAGFLNAFACFLVSSQVA